MDGISLRVIVLHSAGWPRVFTRQICGPIVVTLCTHRFCALIVSVLRTQIRNSVWWRLYTKSILFKVVLILRPHHLVAWRDLGLNQDTVSPLILRRSQGFVLSRETVKTG